MPTTINTLVDDSHCPLTHISKQVIYTAIQSDLIPHKHHCLIYCLRTFLWILKFGYPASNIVINSSLFYRALILCVTPFYLKHLTIYGLSIIILESSIGTMNNNKYGYIDTLFLCTLAHGHTTNITQTHQHDSPG